MSVEIKIYGETAKDALDELSGLASGMRPTGFRPELAAPYGTGSNMTVDEAYAAAAAQGAEPSEQPAARGHTVAQNSTRKRGEPSPGKKRRTAAEVAEDEAAEAAENAAKQNISTGEARVDPENPEEAADSEADAAQDAADEAAEVEAHRDPEKPLTIDDVKAAVMAYAEKYGMPAAQADGPRIFVEALGVPPKGEEFWKFSILPVDDQEKIRKVISIWQRATTENPFKH
jgi:hypothetical protein